MAATPPSISAYFQHPLRLLITLGTTTTSFKSTQTIAWKDFTQANLQATAYLRADLMVIGDSTGSAQEQATVAAEYTHEAGNVLLEHASPALVKALQEKGFILTPVPNLYTKKPSLTPEEYDEHYLERWGDLDFTKNWKLEGEQILAHLPKHLTKETVRVLDVGCLNGYMMEALHRSGVKQVYGTDISHEIAVTHCVNPYHLPAITVCDFPDNTYPDNFSTLTICMEVLEHLKPENTDKFIAELRRVTAPDGVILISSSEDWEVDPTHLNCRKRNEWYYLFAQHDLIPAGKQVVFPGFNSFVVKRAPNMNQAQFYKRLTKMSYQPTRTHEGKSLSFPILKELTNYVRYRTPGGKYAAEIDFWKQSIKDYEAWYQGRKAEVFGTPTPSPEQKIVGPNLKDSAILTWTNVHQKPKYLADLGLEPNTFKGMKLLDIGAGPIPSANCFEGADLYCLDPLYDQYLAAGFPIHYWKGVTFVKGYSEAMPLDDHSFDAVISVNAIDHVDSLAKTSQEIRRVLKKGGKFAMHVHYHKATTTEPLEITDAIFLKLFAWVTNLHKVEESNMKLGGWKIPEGEKYVLWRNF